MLTGKNVVVTGCSRGIGLSILEQFADNGASVIANSRSLSELKAATSHLKNCICISGDVTVPAEANNLIIEATKYNKSIDVLVCNVGSGASVPPGEETLDDWHSMFSKNFYSCINVIQAAKPFLSAGSSIVCVSSICGKEVIPSAPIAYSCAKAALNFYVKAASHHLGQIGIRINAVVPGNVLFDGSVWDKKLKSNYIEVKKNIESEVPLSTFASPLDIAETVMWLSGNNAKFITGSLLTVDGGQTRSL